MKFEGKFWDVPADSVGLQPILQSCNCLLRFPHQSVAARLTTRLITKSARSEKHPNAPGSGYVQEFSTALSGLPLGSSGLMHCNAFAKQKVPQHLQSYPIPQAGATFKGFLLGERSNSRAKWSNGLQCFRKKSRRVCKTTLFLRLGQYNA